MRGFFEQLAEVCEGLTLTMSISMKEGKMTVSLVPMVSNKKIHPISVSNADPKELDEQFLAQMVGVILENRPKILGAVEMAKSIKTDQVKQNKIETKGTPENKKAQEAPKVEEKPKIVHQPGLDL